MACRSLLVFFLLESPFKTNKLWSPPWLTANDGRPFLSIGERSATIRSGCMDTLPPIRHQWLPCRRSRQRAGSGWRGSWFVFRVFNLEGYRKSLECLNDTPKVLLSFDSNRRSISTFHELDCPSDLLRHAFKLFHELLEIKLCNQVGVPSQRVVAVEFMLVHHSPNDN